MMRPNLIIRRVFLCCAISAAGCAPSIENSDDKNLLDEINGSTSLLEDQPIAVPDGTARELFNFVVELEQNELGMVDRQSADYSKVLSRVMTARVEACDKILRLDPEQTDQLDATRMKLHALRTLSVLDPSQTAAYQEFLGQLEQQEDPQFHRIVAISEFERCVTDYLTQADASSNALLDRCDRMLAVSGAGEDVMEAVRQASAALYQNGDALTSADVLARAGKAFDGHPELSEAATRLVSEASQLRISHHVEQVLDEEATLDDLAREIQQGLRNPIIADDVVSYGLQAALVLETQGHYANAQKAYDFVLSEYQDSSEDSLGPSVEHSVTLAKRRIGLLENPLEVEGALLDGEPFRWEDYRGAGVVLCFWQSWNPSWIEEVRNLRRIVGPYRDQGVKIVTINLDDDRNGLERYLQEKPLSLPIVVNPDTTMPGIQNPNAVRCGIETVPFSILVDAEGMVVEIHARGDRLDKALRRLHPNEDQALQGRQLRLVSHLAPNQETEDPSAADLDEQLESINPYAPPADASPLELIDFVLEMQEKPRSIQRRSGFTAGLIEATDRVIASDAKPSWKTLALLTKAKYLHREASFGDQQAEEQLQGLIARWQDDPREDVAKVIEFLQLEQRALEADELATDQLPGLLDELIAFCEASSLDERHLRLASQSVHIANRLDAADREPYFQKLGAQFAKSSDRRLAAYGKRVAKTADGGQEHLNQPLELAGITTDGVRFNWASYRGSWVVVDFWATWCGPCRRAMPELRKLADNYDENQVRIVGVSLDEDMKALSEYLAEEKLPWTNLAGSDAQQSAEKYGVRVIPNLMLVDAEGRIRYVTNKVEDVAARLATELETGS